MRFLALCALVGFESAVAVRAALGGYTLIACIAGLSVLCFLIIARRSFAGSLFR